VTLTLAQLQALATSVGFPDPALAAAVAMAESGGDTTITDDTRGWTDDQIRAKFNLSPTTRVAQEYSVGLWQINAWCRQADGTYAMCRDPIALVDPAYNARAAYAISSGGRVWRPWTTYNTGAYRQFYQPAVYIRPPAPTPGTGIGGALLGAAAIAAAGGYAAHAMRRAHA
jgi:hypothetical protein